MLEDRRLSQLEIAGLIICAVFFLSTFGRLIVEPSGDSTPQLHSTNRVGPKVPANIQQEISNASGEEQVHGLLLDCNDRKDADLCAQLRMAKATEDQSGLNYIGVLLLVATLVATSSAAVFAGLTWLTMKRTAMQELRAYLSITGGAFILDGAVVTAELEFRNSGQTPAYDVRTFGLIRVGETSGTENLLTSLPDQKTYAARSILGPACNLQVRLQTVIIGEMDAIEAETQSIFFSGAVEYTDAFGSPRHFIFNIVATGKASSHRLGSGAQFLGWLFTPHGSGYKAN